MISSYYPPQQAKNIIPLFYKELREDSLELFPNINIPLVLDAKLTYWLFNKSQISWLQEAIESLNSSIDMDYDIFEILIDTEFSQVFLDYLQPDQNLSFQQACLKTLNAYRDHLEIFYQCHVLNQLPATGFLPENSFYQPQQELGEERAQSNQKIRIGGYYHDTFFPSRPTYYLQSAAG